MEQSYSDSDLSMSPSQILERLEMLRKLQLLQRGKLKKQQLRYDSPDLSNSAITEVVSHFNSCSYNTFRSLLQSSQESKIVDSSEHVQTSQKDNLNDLIDGVELLNLSAESEFISNAPVYTSFNDPHKTEQESAAQLPIKKAIALDEMPILTPKKSFESIIVQKLQLEKVNNSNPGKIECIAKCKLNEPSIVKRTYLKRGEGMSRFGIKKNELVIQNTKSLPWRQRNTKINKTTNIKLKSLLHTPTNKSNHGHVSKNETNSHKDNCIKDLCNKSIEKKSPALNCNLIENQEQTVLTYETDNLITMPRHMELLKPDTNYKRIENPKDKHPFVNSNGKTWAAVLSKEQNEFLRKLKQSDYYKNFSSPCKSTISDTSCDDYYYKQKNDKETAEQNLFELIENKVTHDSFNLENSFFNRFLQKNVVDDSGESTPLILKKCLSDNPNLIHILPGIKSKKCENSGSDIDTCNSECIECSETCSSVSSCCSCKTIAQNNCSQASIEQEKSKEKVSMPHIPVDCIDKKSNQKLDICQDDTVINNNNTANIDMVEMNAKLIATSDLLKDRLKELEDEIETFRRENINLTKVREDLDQERQKFYEEKREFEQKFNEEKILSEYYLSEEKEKLQKQKQIYERYVKDIRGRLSKKEKDEVVNLKKEIQDLKEEIRIKDAKSTSSIARLRNQLKIYEKEKKKVEEETEKLKKENRRIQHSNEITRRLTNLKYLEQINKKLSNMATKDNQVDVVIDPDIRFKSFAIERQSRSKTVQPVTRNMRQRAKSVPNLNVTSRYAKYFSQKDSLSDMENKNTLNIEDSSDHINDYSDNEDVPGGFEDPKTINRNLLDSDDENHLEKIYNDRFKEKLSATKIDNDKTSIICSDSTDRRDIDNNTNGFFIRKTNNNSMQHPMSSVNISLSPHGHNSSGASNVSCHLSNGSNIYNISKESEGITENQNYKIDLSEIVTRNKSPSSFLSSYSIQNQKCNRNLQGDARLIPSPEPASNRSNTSKTNLNPLEYTKPDGSKELRFPNGNVKFISADGKYSKFMYYNGDVKENFYNEGRIKYFYAESKTYHTTHADGLEVLEFPDGQIEKRYKDGSSEIRLPNGSVRYFDPKNEHVREEWRFPDGAALTVSANGEQRVKFANGQVEVHTKDHKRREFPDGTVKLVYSDGTSETRYASGRVRIKDKHGNLIMDSAPG